MGETHFVQVVVCARIQAQDMREGLFSSEDFHYNTEQIQVWMLVESFINQIW